jgi:hypothetical protein
MDTRYSQSYLVDYKKLKGSPLAKRTKIEPCSTAALLPTFNSPSTSCVAVINCNVLSSCPVGAKKACVPFTGWTPSRAHRTPSNRIVANVFVLAPGPCGKNFPLTANVPSNVKSTKTGSVLIVVGTLQFALALHPLNVRLSASPMFVAELIFGLAPLSTEPLHFMVTPAASSLPSSSTAAVVASALVPFSMVPLTINPAVTADADADANALSASTPTHTVIIIFALDIPV